MFRAVYTCVFKDYVCVYLYIYIHSAWRLDEDFQLCIYKVFFSCLVISHFHFLFYSLIFCLSHFFSFQFIYIIHLIHFFSQIIFLSKAGCTQRKIKFCVECFYQSENHWKSKVIMFQVFILCVCNLCI